MATIKIVVTNLTPSPLFLTLGETTTLKLQEEDQILVDKTLIDTYIRDFSRYRRQGLIAFNENRDVTETIGPQGPRGVTGPAGVSDGGVPVVEVEPVSPTVNQAWIYHAPGVQALYTASLQLAGMAGSILVTLPEQPGLSPVALSLYQDGPPDGVSDSASGIDKGFIYLEYSDTATFDSLVSPLNSYFQANYGITGAVSLSNPSEGATVVSDGHYDGSQSDADAYTNAGQTILDDAPGLSKDGYVLSQQVNIAAPTSITEMGAYLTWIDNPIGLPLAGSVRFRLVPDAGGFPILNTTLSQTAWMKLTDLTSSMTHFIFAGLDAYYLPVSYPIPMQRVNLQAGTYHLVLEGDSVYNSTPSSSGQFIRWWAPQQMSPPRLITESDASGGNRYEYSGQQAVFRIGQATGNSTAIFAKSDSQPESYAFKIKGITKTFDLSGGGSDSAPTEFAFETTDATETYFGDFPIEANSSVYYEILWMARIKSGGLGKSDFVKKSGLYAQSDGSSVNMIQDATIFPNSGGKTTAEDVTYLTVVNDAGTGFKVGVIGLNASVISWKIVVTPVSKLLY
jgi:hypothetical protein